MSIVQDISDTLNKTDNNEIVKSFGTILKNNPLVLEESLKFASSSVSFDFPLPKNFDGRKIWKNFINPEVSNQGTCGNCYAHATCGALEDRFRIQTYNKIKIDGKLSALHMGICEYERDLNWKELRENLKAQETEATKGHAIGACNGNSLYNAIDFLYRYGVPDTRCLNEKNYANWCNTIQPKCKPITEYKSDTDLPTCEQLVGNDYDTCLDTDNAIRRFRAIGIYNVPSNERAIQSEIYKFGPVAIGYMVYGDFLNGYDGKSIYTHPDKRSSFNGGHACSCYGWGEEEQDGRMVKYWLIKNSWSDKWGDGGWFKIERGIPELQLEQNVVAMIPDIPYLILKCIPSQIKFIQAARDDEKRKEFDIDPITGYRKITIEKIRNGTLKGSLTPLVNVNDVVDFCTFIAGLMSKNPEEEAETEELYYPQKNNKIKKIIIFVMIIIIGYIGIKTLKK